MSAKDALLNHHKKQLKQIKKRSKKNNKPEKIVEKDVMHWLKTMGFDCNVVESKAVYSQKAGIYLHSQTDPGFSDIAGNNDNGLSVYIELKAKDRRSTLKEHQRQFLIRKINTNCFAVCVDSAERLENFYKKWGDILIRHGRLKAQKYLINILPVKKSKDSDELF